MKSETEPIVYVVDDDRSVLKSLARLIKSVGWAVQTFGSAQEFLDSEFLDHPGCLVLDIKMPGVTGLELQERLAAVNCTLPIVFITGQGTISASVKAMKAGAIDFLEKPFDEDTLLEAIRLAIIKDEEKRQKSNEIAAIRERLEKLTPREREVFQLVVTGLLNKQIAYRLGVTEKTVKVHRAHIMQKMEARSLANLVHLSEKLTEGLAL